MEKDNSRDLSKLNPIDAGNRIKLLSKTLEEISSAVSHDLRNPIISLIYFFELSEDEISAKCNEEVMQMLPAVKEACSKMMRIIQDLMDLSDIAAVMPSAEETNLESLMGQINIYLKDTLSKTGGSLYCGPLPIIEAEERHMLVLFKNLIENSLYFRSEAPTEIRLSCTEKEGEYLFSVKDNGIGISRENHERIFRPFKRLMEDTHNGTGIGLAKCRKIVEIYGGRIWVESAPGQGAVFSFTLPKKPK